MRDPNTGNHPCGANGSGTNANFDSIHACINKGLGTLIGSGLTTNNIDVLGCGLSFEFGHHIQNALRVTVSGIYDQQINSGVNERHGTFKTVTKEAYGAAHQEAAFFVFGSVREFLGFIEVLDGDKAFKFIVGIDQWQFFNAVFLQEAHHFVTLDVEWCSDQRHLGHNFTDGSSVVFCVWHESGVAVGDDSQQNLIFIYNRQTRNPVSAT